MIHTILSRKTVFNGHAFDVEKLQVRLPDGRERAYDLVSHKDSVTLVPLDSDGTLLFVSQYRMGCECEMLELPAGVMDDGETPEACAAREIREETGMAAGSLRLLGSVYLAAGYSSEINHILLATGLTHAPLDMDEDEFLNVKRFSVEVIRKMIEKGELIDSKSLAALLLARAYLN
ncbi:MAG: NUDIX hydrolase [Pelolinea sp.]|nr:NUDIX hydrolase [Pelolinea sp.]